jgi:hypothetical protein
MSNGRENSGRDELELRQLFDESATEVSQGDVDRLARFAASIPAQAAARTRWRWLPSLQTQRGVAVGVAALCALAFIFVRSYDFGDAAVGGKLVENTPVVAPSEPTGPGGAPPSPSLPAEDLLLDLDENALAALSAGSLAAFDDELFDDELAGLDLPDLNADAVDGAAWIELYDNDALDDG